MNEFPFPKLLSFLESAADQVEFMRVAAEAGLGSSDVELAKLLLALQIYASIYARIPREIKAVHADAIAEIKRLRDEIEFLANRAESDAVKIGQWAEQIHRSLEATEPKQIAKVVHKRLLDDTITLLGGSIQVLKTAYGQIDTATDKMNEAAYHAAAGIDRWQALSLRRVWASAFCVSFLAAFVVLTGIWFVFLR